MSKTNYFASGENDKPKKLIKQCIVCTKKKHLIFYCSTNDFLLQICNKCNNKLGDDANCVTSEVEK